jgi:hypothetical protein
VRYRFYIEDYLDVWNDGIDMDNIGMHCSDLGYCPVISLCKHGDAGATGSSRDSFSILVDLKC